MVTFDDLMKGFGVVTVMNACIFIPKKSYTGAKNCKTAGKDSEGGMKHTDFVPAYEYLDTLKIANFTQEGPTKTVTGGQYANPLIKYGKTMTAEIQDALGRASTLERFFGADYDGYEQYTGDGTTVDFTFRGLKTDDKLVVRVNGEKQKETDVTITPETPAVPATETEEAKPAVPGSFKLATAPEDGAVITATKPGGRISITDKFPGPFAIEGDTFFIDQKTGEKKHVFIFIPQFLPDAILTLTQDAEGDATVFDLNGSASVTAIEDETGSRDIFYEIRETSFFAEEREAMDI